MLAMAVVGTLFNLLCLAVLQRRRDLKLSDDYLFLLRMQSIVDLLYLITSTPVTAFPFVFPAFREFYEPHVLPWIFPFVQISMICSIYTTVALAFERYLAIRECAAQGQSGFPTRVAAASIVLFSFLINAPRFVEMSAVRVNRTTLEMVNNTGDILKDWTFVVTEHWVIQPTAEFYTLEYFLGYNMIGSFLISLLIPGLTLAWLNMLIWRRLKVIWSSRVRLGVNERRNTRAAFSLVFVVILFFVCHSVKLVVSGYQVRPQKRNMRN